VPYPDTSFSKDMQNGSKTVMINDQEVMLKDQSFYQTSPLGDEAATNSLGAGVISHVITGKTYFVAWSMDVQFEGQNVDRHLDMTTSNHASPPANEQLPLPGLEDMAMPPAEKEKKCKELHDEKDKICKQIPKGRTVPKNPKKYLEEIRSGKKPVKQQRELCAELDAKIKATDDCLAARKKVTDECFGGVTDARHEEQEKQLKAGRDRAIEQRKVFCQGQQYMGSPTGEPW
jgi:hypothetical protein